jgi:hypothetical protein
VLTAEMNDRIGARPRIEECDALIAKAEKLSA